jgi:hypothetical protein
MNIAVGMPCFGFSPAAVAHVPTARSEREPLPLLVNLVAVPATIMDEPVELVIVNRMPSIDVTFPVTEPKTGVAASAAATAGRAKNAATKRVERTPNIMCSPR